MLNGKIILGITTLLIIVCMSNATAEDPVRIRIAQKYLFSDSPEDVAHIERIERAMADNGIYIDIEVVDVPSSSYTEKLGLMLLSRDIPDLIYFQGGDQRFANQDLLEDWRPWIAKTEHLKNALWPHNISRLENYPFLLYVYPQRTSSAVMRKDWLEKSGLQAPQTLDDWSELLGMLSASDFDQDGSSNTYGMTMARNTEDLDIIFNRAFGISATWLKNSAGEWIDARVSDQERDKLSYYHMLFKEGMIDPEFITSNWEILEDKFYTGKAAVVMARVGINVDIYRTKLRQLHPSAELVLLDPPAGVGQGLKAIDVSKEPRGFSISVLSEHKEEVVALMDFLASPEGQMMERMGFEGEHFLRNGDSFVTTEKMGTWYPRFLIAQPASWTPPVELLSPVAQASLDQSMAYFMEDNAIIFPRDFAARVNAVENYYRTSVYRFVSGEMSFTDWDDYVAGWYAVGGSKLTEYARENLVRAHDSD
jgi:putative aldouronate transport system substrate-binding protein